MQTIAHCKDTLNAYEFKITRLRKTSSLPLSGTLTTDVLLYWKTAVITGNSFTAEVECLAVVFLDSRHRIRGHHITSIGTLDTLMCHPREVFRSAIALSAFAVVLAHNHPSGDPTPSMADIEATSDLRHAGQHIGIAVIDHVIIGNDAHYSFKDHNSL